LKHPSRRKIRYWKYY